MLQLSEQQVLVVESRKRKKLIKKEIRKVNQSVVKVNYLNFKQRPKKNNLIDFLLTDVASGTSISRLTFTSFRSNTLPVNTLVSTDCCKSKFKKLIYLSK